MAKLKLTAKGVEKLSTQLPQEDFWDMYTPGLHLRVSGATGRKTWLVRYRANGSQRRVKLGRYSEESVPDADLLSLADARAKARAYLSAASTGTDLRAVEEEKREAEALKVEAAVAFRDLADEVLEALARKGRNGEPTREATQRERRRIVDAELLPVWGDREAGGITRRDVVLLVEAIERRGAPVLANRTLALISTLFNTALRRAIVGLEFNPAHMVDPPGVEEGRTVYLKVPEINAVWIATEPEGLLTRAAFRLALLTGQRIGSVLAMRWDGIEGDLWTIPPEHFKGRRTHLVPLSPEALAVLQELRENSVSDEWVFPSRAGSAKPHLSNLGKALSRIRKRSGVKDWTIHDFRTTWRTHAVRSPDERTGPGLGVPAHVADAVLGHKEASLGFGRYTGDQHLYLLAEKRAALEKWGSFVRKAVNGEG